MKKQIIDEPEFIGGQGALTKEEELTLTQYLSAKKAIRLKEKANQLKQFKSSELCKTA